MSMNVNSPSPPFIFRVKNVTLTREVVKFVVTQPLPPDKNGFWLDYAMIPSSFTHTHT